MHKFYEAWKYLNEHPAFADKYGISHFQQLLDIEVVMVNPENDTIDDDENKNTKEAVWLECGKYSEKYGDRVHDIDLDCGGDTFEEAILELAKLVKVHYKEIEENYKGEVNSVQIKGIIFDDLEK